MRALNHLFTAFTSHNTWRTHFTQDKPWLVCICYAKKKKTDLILKKNEISTANNFTSTYFLKKITPPVFNLT